MTTTARSAITAIETRLEAILVANGYNTGAGANVYLGVPSFDDGDVSFPLLAILSGPESVEQITWRRYRCTREIRIHGYVKGITDTTANLEKLIEDVQQAVEGSDETLGGLVHAIVYEGLDDPDEREDGSEFTGMVVRYSIEYDREHGA